MGIKNILYNNCLNFVEQRIQNANSSFNSAKESANSETKSSSGDKHETGRAMAQLEQEKASQMLFQANQLKVILNKINPNLVSVNIALGSLVITNLGNYYIAISAGKTIVEEKTYFAISSNSPMGEHLIGKPINHNFQLNGINYQVLKIY